MPLGQERPRWIHTSAALLAVALAGQPAAADVSLPSVFGDHMVLQCDAPLMVFGWAAPSEIVGVSLRREGEPTAIGEARADSKGRWTVELPPQQAGGPCELVVSAANEIVLSDVWIGEVWLCSGQSNMEWALSETDEAEEELERDAQPELRLFSIARTAFPEAAENIAREGTHGMWRVSDEESAAPFSAVAYHFGRELARELGRPVGLIQAAWGGTPVEAWIPPAVVTEDRDAAALAERWKEHPWGLGEMYQGMIAPLERFPLRGVAWYQGESNADRAEQYARLFPLMIESWRERFGRELPFVFVQLPNFRGLQPEPMESAWAELREAQTAALALPATGMAVTIELGDVLDIHPRKKRQVGVRLALAAMQAAYGSERAFSGPVLGESSFEAGGVELRFEHVGDGLRTRDGGALQGFAVAGEDRVFRWAEAELVAPDRVRLLCPGVSPPVAVRYAWMDNPVCNLVDSDGLPAGPFRTDDWPGVTTGAR